MKRLIAIFLIILLLSSCKTAGIQNRLYTEMANQPTLVCSLPDPALQERKKNLQMAVFSKLKQLEELENGYAFGFDHEKELLQQLFQYIEAEGECCPFFEHQLTVKAEKEGLVWHITGVEGVKPVIKGLLLDMGLLEEESR